MLTIGRTEGAQVGAGDVFVLAFRTTSFSSAPAVLTYLADPSEISTRVDEVETSNRCVCLLLVLPTRPPSAPPLAELISKARTHSVSLSTSF